MPARHKKTALILVDHGSRLVAANDMLLQVVTLFKHMSGLPIVEPAHMEIASPSLEEAFDRCVAQGATNIIVYPYFLAPGRHSTGDIPRMVQTAAVRYPDVKIHVTPPLGLDEKITQVIWQRVQQCLQAEMDCSKCPDQACAQRKHPKPG